MKLIAPSVFSNVYLPSDVLKRLTKWQFLIQNRVHHYANGNGKRQHSMQHVLKYQIIWTSSLLC
jgi:hypothetical protein